MSGKDIVIENRTKNKDAMEVFKRMKMMYDNDTICPLGYYDVMSWDRMNRLRFRRFEDMDTSWSGEHTNDPDAVEFEISNGIVSWYNETSYYPGDYWNPPESDGDMVDEDANIWVIIAPSKVKDTPYLSITALAYCDYFDMEAEHEFEIPADSDSIDMLYWINHCIACALESLGEDISERQCEEDDRW